MRAIAIVFCLMLVAGCSERDTVAPTVGFATDPTMSPATATIDPCDTASTDASTRKLASIAPIESDDRTLATSWAMLRDINELAWASHLIVRGRVIADCGEDGDNGRQVVPDFDARMLVEIDALYRGQPRETILVPSTSDGYSSDSSMLISVGSNVILFLEQPDDGGAFLVGGPQGHWRVVGDRVYPNAPHFPSLPLDTFEQTLAAAMRQEPPATSEVRSVSLDAAPLGPDLLADTEPPQACNSDIPPVSEYIERFSDLTWLSELVVIGTVSDVHDAFYPEVPDTDSSMRVPVTDYVVNVEQQLRGMPIDSVTVRQPGGTVDGCEVRVSGAPDLQVGDRLLLYLTPVDKASSLYRTTAGQRGLWKIGDDGALAANTAWQSYPQVVPTDDLARSVASALDGAIPPDQWSDYDPVPLATAPLGDTSWPVLKPDTAVSQHTDSLLGLMFDLPETWTVLAGADDGSLSITSWPATSVEEPVPVDEVRITIHRTSSENWFDDPNSVPVSVAGTTGWLYFFASDRPTDEQVDGQTWEIHANFWQAEASWLIQATFGSQPSVDDPATHAFYALLRSIQHSTP